MRFIKPYQEFNINEKENTSYSPLSAYRAVALGVSRALNLLGYFYSIAKPEVDPSEWERLMSNIKKARDLNSKWDNILSTSKEIQNDIERYARGRRDSDLNIGRFFDVGVHSKSIPVALEKFRAASNLLTQGLTDKNIKDRLALIDGAIPENPYTLSESDINEAFGKKRAPSEAEVLMLADGLRSSVTQALSTARELKEIFPDSRSFINNVVDRYITPASEKVKDVIETEAPDPSLKISKSVKNSYKRKGWTIDSVKDKYFVDQYEDLMELQESVREGIEKIGKAKDNIIDELAPSTDAGEFIEAGNRILDSIEDKIAEKEKVRDLRRRASLMIPIAQDEELPSVNATPVSTSSAPGRLVDPNELRALLQRRINRRQ
jgi:hypothetical protein